MSRMIFALIYNADIRFHNGENIWQKSYTNNFMNLYWKWSWRIFQNNFYMRANPQNVPQKGGRGSKMPKKTLHMVYELLPSLL